jgi:hypothetical protein
MLTPYFNRLKVNHLAVLDESGRVVGVQSERVGDRLDVLIVPRSRTKVLNQEQAQRLIKMILRGR